MHGEARGQLGLASGASGGSVGLLASQLVLSAGLSRVGKTLNLPKNGVFGGNRPKLAEIGK